MLLRNEPIDSNRSSSLSYSTVSLVARRRVRVASIRVLILY